MTITNKPASLFHIAKAMKALVSKELRAELRSLNTEKESELGLGILSLMMSYPDEIITAVYYINREEATLEEIQAIDDATELEKLITALIANNQSNVSTFVGFFGKAMQGQALKGATE